VLYWKEVIRPGSYWYVDPEDGKPKKLTVTAEGVRRLLDQGNAMLSAGLSVPVPLEHQPEARPLTPQERAARNLASNTGWVKRYALAAGGRLFSLLDIQDESIIPKLPTTIKYTSPWITSFTDGDGRHWDGVIGHLALTSRPRIHRQEPFGQPAAALSLAAENTYLVKANPVPPRGLFLSRAGLLRQEGAALAPAYPLAFSVWCGAALAGNVNLADDEKKSPPEKGPPEKGPPEKGKDDNGKPPAKDPPAKLSPDQPPAAADPNLMVQEEEITLTDILCDVVSALWGVDLPEGTTEDNLLQNLLRSLMDHLKTGGAPGGLPEPEGLDKEKDMNQPPPNAAANSGTPGAARPPVVQEQPPVYMSLEEIGRVADPAVRASLQTGYALRANVLAQAESARDRRIERLAARRKDPKFGEKITAMKAGAPLSLGADGKVHDPMSQALELLEEGTVELPALLNAVPGTGVAFGEELHPREPAPGEISPERRKQVADDLARMAGAT